MKTVFEALKLFSKLSAVTNWKTTGIGLVAAILAVVYDISVAGTWDKWTVIKAVIAAASGFLAKDATVTGGVIVSPGVATGQASAVASSNSPVTKTELPESPDA